ncbi:MAG: CPBP family intramembrane metalloprotease [Alphaproteobacteria bacterium]|nr:CPBP family intramembrane metalloprotease [Alphaproteobacteria bacterium]
MTMPKTIAAPYPRLGQAIGLVVAVLVLQGLVVFLLSRSVPGARGAAHLASFLVVANLVSFGLVIAWAVRRMGLPFLEALPFAAVRPVVYGPLIVTVLGFGILLSEADNLVRWILPMPEFLAEAFRQVGSGGAASLLAVVVVAPVVEELLLRGIILRGFLGRYRPGTAIFLSALIFGAMHLNPYQSASALVMGLVLGWLFYRSGSLWPCIFGHALFNAQGFIVSALLPFRIRGYNPETVNTSTVEFQPLWFDLAGLALAGLGLALLLRALRREAVWDRAP